MSRFAGPSASRAARQRAVLKGRRQAHDGQAFIDPNYDRKRVRRKMATASRRANR